MPGPKKGTLVRSKEYYVELANKIHNNFYNYDKFVYSGAYNKSIIICPDHGEFEQSMNCHTNKSRGRGCPKCGIEKVHKGQRKTQEQYISEIKLVHGDKYILDKIKFITAHSAITPICRIHGEWKTSAHSFHKGHGCPLCKESHGEKLIAKILDEYGVKYERQKRYSDCRGKCYTLPFDFFIPSINLLIEYDGEQHFRAARWTDIKQANDALKELQKRDAIKTEYCKNNNIPLLRMSYTMSEDVIRRELGSWLYLR